MDRTDFMKEYVAKYQELIYEAADHIWANPETGFREWKTSAYLADQFEKLGYTLTMAGNIPGFYTDLDTGRPGPRVAIMGEMDSLIVGNHPAADSETSAVHACGHHAQCAILLGVAAALKEPGALDEMCGSIRLMAVPGEELIELGFREELRKQGIIRFFGGKAEYIARGYFDDVDMTMMIHSGSLPEGKHLSVGFGSNGCITKNIIFKGIASHAAAPDLGKNALYAANCAINAANALRETFVDEEHIRFHPIITEGGLAVNAIPETVKMEAFVRGASYESILKYNEKINQAFAASAAAMDCQVEIDDRPGYFPLRNDANLSQVLKDAMEQVAGPGSSMGREFSKGCSDMGDVSSIMPASHPCCSGSVGLSHGKDFYVANKEYGCLYLTQCLAVAAYLLLRDEAKTAKHVIKEAKPYFSSKEEYLAAMEGMTLSKESVVYCEDGTIRLDFHNQ